MCSCIADPEASGSYGVCGFLDKLTFTINLWHPVNRSGVAPWPWRAVRAAFIQIFPMQILCPDTGPAGMWIGRQSTQCPPSDESQADRRHPGLLCLQTGRLWVPCRLLDQLTLGMDQWSFRLQPFLFPVQWCTDIIITHPHLR